MRYLLFVFLLLFSTAVLSQDIHFSQFYNAPLSQNAALAGAMDADQRLIANYRHQWFSVPVPYETFAASYDQKLNLRKLKNHYLGIGGQFMYDQAGDANLNWSQLATHAAFHYKVSDNSYLSAGLQLRFGQRALKPEQLYFGDQYIDNFFDPDAPSQENFLNTSAAYFSLGSGLNWYLEPTDTRSRIWIGVGGQHLNQPTIDFLGGDEVALPILLNAYAMGLLQIHEYWDIAANVSSQLQGPYQEYLFMSGARYHLSLDKHQSMAVQLGGGYRLEDAMIAYLDIFYNSWKFGFSYDINTSSLQRATNRNGGPEISLQYLVTLVKPPAEFKICPIF